MDVSKSSQLHMHQCSPFLPVLRAAFTVISSLCYPMPPSHNLSNQPRSNSYPPSSYMRHQHLFSHTVLIHILHLSKPSQHSPCTTVLLYTYSFLLYSTCHSYKTPQTLCRKHILVFAPELSTSPVKSFQKVVKLPGLTINLPWLDSNLLTSVHYTIPVATPYTAEGVKAHFSTPRKYQ